MQKNYNFYILFLLLVTCHTYNLPSGTGTNASGRVLQACFNNIIQQQDPNKVREFFIKNPNFDPNFTLQSWSPLKKALNQNQVNIEIIELLVNRNANESSLNDPSDRKKFEEIVNNLKNKNNYQQAITRAANLTESSNTIHSKPIINNGKARTEFTVIYAEPSKYEAEKYSSMSDNLLSTSFNEDEE